MPGYDGDALVMRGLHDGAGPDHPPFVEVVGNTCEQLFVKYQLFEAQTAILVAGDRGDHQDAHAVGRPRGLAPSAAAAGTQRTRATPGAASLVNCS